MADAHKNFAYSTVATAPSPASSGTSLVVAAGEGALFPAVPFNVTVWPAGVQPLSTNAEIARVTAISTDTLTITRAQESSVARSVVAGDQIAATITNKTLTDIETSIIPAYRQQVRSSYTAGEYTSSATTGVAMTITAMALNVLRLVPFQAQAAFSFDRMRIYLSATANARLGVYLSDGAQGMPSTLLIDAGVITGVGAGDKELTGLSQPLVAGQWYWLGVVLDTSVSIGTYNQSSVAVWEPSSPASGTSFSCMERAFAYGALPSPAGAVNKTITPPAIQLRVA